MLEKISSYFGLRRDNTAKYFSLYLTGSSVTLLQVTEAGVTLCQTLDYSNTNWQDALRSLMARLPSGSVFDLTLASEFYQLVQLDKPALGPAELMQALPWQVKDLVSVPPEDMMVDYIDLPGYSAQQAKVNVVVAQKSWLKQLVKFISNAGMQLRTIQPAEWMAHYLTAPVSQPTMLVIHEPDQEVLLQIVQDGMLYFSRRTRGLAQLHQLNGQGKSHDMLERLSLELQRSMDYFESQLKQAPVREIRVLAQDAHLLCQLLAENGFARVTPLVVRVELASYADQLVFCWPAVAAALAGAAE